MAEKGQGALEYLLLIGGAVLVAVIVITLLLNIANQGQTQTGDTSAAALCRQQNALAGTANGAACTGTVPLGNDTYNCGGTYPNCTAST
ncbi:MAG: class III signal peptide-containing protein [archaeon]|nr:class III signal peptide-containing protein [archaeon]